MGKQENDVTGRIRRLLKSARVWHFKHWGGPRSPKGIADIIGIRRVRVDDLVKAGVDEVGIFIAIEIKVPGHAWSKPTKEQQAFIDNVNQNKGIGFVAHTTGEVIDKLSLRKRIHPLFSEEAINE